MFRVFSLEGVEGIVQAAVLKCPEMKKTKQKNLE